MFLKRLPINDIRPWPELEALLPIRRNDLGYLRADLEKHGPQLPLVVDQTFRLIDGYRRLHIMLDLGIEEAWCLVKAFTGDDEAVAFALTNKISSQNLHPTDRSNLLRMLGDTGSAKTVRKKTLEARTYVPEQLLALYESGDIGDQSISKLIQEMKAVERAVGKKGVEHVKTLLDGRESPWLKLATIRGFLKNDEIPDSVKQQAMEERWPLTEISSATWRIINRKTVLENRLREREKEQRRRDFEEKYGRVPDHVAEEHHRWVESRLRQFFDNWGISRDRALSSGELEQDRLVSERMKREIEDYREQVEERRADLLDRLNVLTNKIERVADARSRGVDESSRSAWDMETVDASLRTPLDEKWAERLPRLEEERIRIDREAGLLHLKLEVQKLQGEYREQLAIHEKQGANHRNQEMDVRIEMLGLLPDTWDTMPEKEWKRFTRAFRHFLHPDRSGNIFNHTSSVVNALLDYAETKRAFNLRRPSAFESDPQP